MGSVVAVIPARYASTRFPGKVLAAIGDRTMLRCVHDRATGCRRLDRILVATDDERVLREALAFGATAVMTSARHRSGTDRVAEAVATAAPEAAFIVDIQADEPFLVPADVDALVSAMQARPEAIWTAVAPLREDPAVARPDVVKAALAVDGRVLYFSRAAIPYLRHEPETPCRWQHVGIYGFPREILDRFVGLPPSPLEEAEGLEQLRALEAGIEIRAIVVEPGFGGVDTVEDLERARRHMRDTGAMGAGRGRE